MPLTGFSAAKEFLTDRMLASDDSGLGNGPVVYCLRDKSQITLTYVHVHYELMQEEGESGTIGEVHTIYVRVRQKDLNFKKPNVDEKMIWDDRTYTVQKDIKEEGTHTWLIRGVSRHVEFRGVTAEGGRRR